MRQEDINEIMYENLPAWKKVQLFCDQKECCLSCKHDTCEWCEMKNFNGSRPNGYDWKTNDQS